MLINCNTIYTGDARELSEAIPDESVDLIFTDPVYQNIDDYRWLAETAARVLKPDRACLAFCSSRHDAHAQVAMDEHLKFLWKLFYTIPGKPGALHLYGLYPCTTICLLFAKGHKKASPYLPDTLISHRESDNGFKWQKNIEVISRWLSSFSAKNDVVFDPFCGSGTVPAVCKMLSRNYLAFEIDPQTADLARQRVAQTQPPLFVVEPEQVEMELK